METNRDNFEAWMERIMEHFEKVHDKLDRMTRQKSCLDGDQLLDNQDLCLLLGVTKRTLQRYRQKKLVTYYMIDGKTYYKASEIHEFLRKYAK